MRVSNPLEGALSGFNRLATCSMMPGVGRLNAPTREEAMQW